MKPDTADDLERLDSESNELGEVMCAVIREELKK